MKKSTLQLIMLLSLLSGAQGPGAQGPWAQGSWAQGPWALGPRKAKKSQKGVRISQEVIILKKIIARSYAQAKTQNHQKRT